MEDVHVLRVVVRNGFSRDLAGLFLEDLRRTTERLERQGSAAPRDDRRTSFHH
jgi:glutamate decarboxylase